MLQKNKDVFKTIAHVALFYYNNLKIKYCKICNKPLIWNAQIRNINYCSKECRFKDSKNIQKKAQQTCLKRYGVKNPYQSQIIKQKIRKTSLQRYGVQHTSSNKDIALKIKNSVNQTYKNKKEQIKEKRIKTVLKRYGVEYPIQKQQIKDKIKITFKQKYGNQYIFKTDYFKERSKQTCLQKYDTQYSFQSQNNKEKSKITNLKRYNVQYAAQSKQIRDKIQSTNLQRYGFRNYNKYILWNNILKQNQYIIPLFQKQQLQRSDEFQWKCVKCGNVFKQKIYCTNHNKQFRYLPRCLKCYPKMYGYSQTQKQIRQFCQCYYNVIANSFKILNRKQLDIYIPQIKLAIQVNGIYWHSRQSGTPLNYHLDKTLQCQRLGIRLIHIWQDQWINNSQQIKNKLIKIFQNKEIIQFEKVLQRDWYSIKKIEGYQIQIMKPQIIIRNGYHCQNSGYLKYCKQINNIKF